MSGLRHEHPVPCRQMVERHSGCHVMTCRCGQRFCYACGATESVYVHSGCSAARAVSHSLQAGLEEYQCSTTLRCLTIKAVSK